MGMDITTDSVNVRMNWKLWGMMIDIIQANGFKGRLPDSNDGETVDAETAKAVGQAVLLWWQSKADASRKQPQLECWESTILAYALLLLVNDGQAKHC